MKESENNGAEGVEADPNAKTETRQEREGKGENPHYQKHNLW